MNKILSNIGLCRRAGFLVAGFDAVLKACTDEKKPVVGILLTSDISEKTEKEIHFKATGKEVVKLPVTMEQIESVLRKRVGVIGITDEGFYKTICAKLTTTD